MGNLFAKPTDKIVSAYDLKSKLVVERNLRNFKFRVGVYGILREGNKILVERHPLSHKYALPGGGVEIGEKLITSLLREFKEETGLRVKIIKLLAVNENMATYKGEDAQGIFIYYEVKKNRGKLLNRGNGTDTAEVKFMDLKKLNSENTQKIYWEAIRSIFKI